MKNNKFIKIGLLFAGVLLVTAFIILDLDRFLSLEYLKASQERFQALYSEHPVAVLGSYLLVYIGVAALSLPGAAVLTLASGALFGLTVGTLLVSIASTVGATIACLVARTLVREWVQGKFGDKLVAFNEGIAKEGGFYLFTLRLIPIFPFFVINLVMGLTPMKLRTFFLVSQIGMLPGTIVYVNAGKELAKIDSLAGILSPSLLASFALLGLFPITVKKIIQYVKPRLVTDGSE